MARIFLDEIGGVNQGGILASYGLPMSPFSTEEYAPTIVETPGRPTRTRRKQSKPKPKRNDGIIRNHDSVWDYKIQDGKLLTRRKTSDGKWYDITSNDEARQRIEQFTGRRISNKQSASNNSSQSSKSASASKPNNSSQSQPSKPASTVQTQQIARPTTTQPTRQQTTRQDSTRRDTTVNSQPRSLARTPASNAEPDWQNMTDAEVQAWFNNNSYGLPEITIETKGNSNKKKNQLLSQEDLDANGWKWSDNIRGINDYGPLFEDAYNRTQQGEKILTDIEGKIIPKSEVNRYINRGRIPLYLSDYDAQFYQPQSEASTRADIRRAQDARRNRDFDNQRNIGLAAMFGAPILAGSLATAPAATLLALGGSEIAGAGFEGAWKRSTGKSWAESLGGNDPNAQFYANMIQPGRIIGGTLGAGIANATAPVRQAIGEAVSNGFNRMIGNAENPSLIGLLRRQIGNIDIVEDLLGTFRGKSPKSSKSLAETTGIPVEEYPAATVTNVKPSKKINLEGPWGDNELAAFEREQAKAFWEHQQPYKVKDVKVMEVATKDGSTRKVYVPQLSNKLRPGANSWGHYRFKDVPFTERFKHPIASLPHRRLNRGLLNSITGLEQFPIQYGRPNTPQELAMLLKQINRAWGQEYPAESFYSIPYIE